MHQFGIEPNWQNRTLFIADNIFILRHGERVGGLYRHGPAVQRQAGVQRPARLPVDHPSIKEIIEAAVLIEGGTVDRSSGRIETGRVRNSIAAFIAYMAPRVVEMHRVLKPTTGVLFLQCDWEANAYLRLLLSRYSGGRGALSARAVGAPSATRSHVVPLNRSVLVAAVLPTTARSAERTGACARTRIGLPRVPPEATT